MMPLRFVIVLFIFNFNCANSENYLPVLLWHRWLIVINNESGWMTRNCNHCSAGTTCCGAETSQYANFIEKELGGEVVVRSVRIGVTEKDDFANSLTVHPFDQVKFQPNLYKLEFSNISWIRLTSCATNWKTILCSTMATMRWVCHKELYYCKLHSAVRIRIGRGKFLLERVEAEVPSLPLVRAWVRLWSPILQGWAWVWGLEFFRLEAQFSLGLA